MASTNRAFCASPQRGFIASPHRARGCGGWEVCVCERADTHNFPSLANLTTDQEENVIATQWRLAWGFNDRLEKQPWSSIRNSGVGAPNTATSAERIRGGDFIINAGQGIGPARISRNKADSQSTQVWSVSTSNVRDMCVDGLNSVVIHGVNDGSISVIVRDLETGNQLYRMPAPGIQVEQLIAIPVQPGGAYARTSQKGLARISSTGSTAWFKPIEGIHNISVDPQGNAYACGGVWTFISAASDPVTSQLIFTQEIRTFVRKYSIGGILLWEWSATGTWVDLTPPGPPGQIPSDGLVQLQSRAAVSNGSRVFVISDYRSPSGILNAKAIILNASTGDLIQRVDLPGDTPLTRADGNLAITPLWVTSNSILIPVVSPVPDGSSFLKLLQSTPQETGPDTWTASAGVKFWSDIKTIRPLITLSP